ncbi:MAG: hypothetical protein LBT09_02595 [Planctomycetaceae bacterium]|jgi:hypothetical protein|nr:hypothetical protein [Planctomycetaceae bacterium]
MKTIKRTFNFVLIVLAICILTVAATNLYSQEKTNVIWDVQIPEHIEIPKYQMLKQFPWMEALETHVYDDVFFYEMVFPDYDKAAKANYTSNKKEEGYYLRIREDPAKNNYEYTYDCIYTAFYSVLHDKDIFPISGALFCRTKSNPRIRYDAFLVPKKYYPEGVTIRHDTFIIPHIPPKNDCNRSNLFGYFSVDRIDKDEKGLLVKITYEPTKDIFRFLNKPKEDISKYTVTKWFRNGDIIQFFKPIPDKNSPDHKFFYYRKYLPSSILEMQAESWGLRIVSIVPRDHYPTRIVGKTKGRLVGWIELDRKAIPLDKDGKPLPIDKEVKPILK